MRKPAALFCLLLTLCGCAAKQAIPVSGEGGFSFTDDLGSTVTLAAPPERTAALLGSFADIWQLAGGEVAAAADDAWEDFSLPLAEDTVNLGQTKSLSLERLFESRPDFVLASANTRIDLEWLDTLRAAGIPAAYFNVSSFDDYLRMLKICTGITGRPELYEQNGLAVKEQVESAKKAAAVRIAEAGEAPSVLLLRASAAMLFAKGSENNIAGEMLRDLGCVNIADSETSLLENVSMEHILLCDPDFIFIMPVGDDTEGMQRLLNSTLLSHPAWSRLTAVAEGRVLLLDKRLYMLKPNARWGEAYQNLERILSDGLSID